MIPRLTAALLGCLSLATGVFAGLNFQPPLGADPGAINACWLTFVLLIVCGLFFIWSATWKIGGAK